MKTFFQELFQYNHHFNREILAVLNNNAASAPEKCVTILSHMLNAHQIWNGRILAGQPPFGSWDIHPIQDLAEIDKKNFEQSMFILDNFGLNQIIQYANSKGKIFNFNIRDVLFQAINHSTYHRGQIATVFRQSGLEPLLTDYIYYKMK
jgi:uncharacterized damage-inducible protein DinB